MSDEYRYKTKVEQGRDSSLGQGDETFVRGSDGGSADFTQTTADKGVSQSPLVCKRASKPNRGARGEVA